MERAWGYLLVDWEIFLKQKGRPRKRGSEKEKEKWCDPFLGALCASVVPKPSQNLGKSQAESAENRVL